MDDLYIESNITRLLDDKLKESKESKDFLRPCAMVRGLTGSGKTPIIKSWLNHNNLKYLFIDAQSMSLSSVEVEYTDWDSVFNGENMVTLTKIEPSVKKKYIDVLLTSSDIDLMNEGNTVVVIDNYDWAPYQVRKHLLNLFLNQVAADPRSESDNFSTKLEGILMFVLVDHPNHEIGEPYDAIEEQIFGEQF